MSLFFPLLQPLTALVSLTCALPPELPATLKFLSWPPKPTRCDALQKGLSMLVSSSCCRNPAKEIFLQCSNAWQPSPSSKIWMRNGFSDWAQNEKPLILAPPKREDYPLGHHYSTVKKKKSIHKWQYFTPTTASEENNVHHEDGHPISCSQARHHPIVSS